MTTELARLKSRLKRGPRMSRQMQAEYVLVQIDGAPRQLRPAVLSKIRVELERLSHSPNPVVQDFVTQMRLRYPEALL